MGPQGRAAGCPAYLTRARRVDNWEMHDGCCRDEDMQDSIVAYKIIFGVPSKGQCRKLCEDEPEFKCVGAEYGGKKRNRICELYACNHAPVTADATAGNCGTSGTKCMIRKKFCIAYQPREFSGNNVIEEGPFPFVESAGGFGSGDTVLVDVIPAPVYDTPGYTWTHNSEGRFTRLTCNVETAEYDWCTDAEGKTDYTSPHPFSDTLIEDDTICDGVRRR